MIANTTCPCRACLNIAGLDLKIPAHHGSFQVLELAGRRELSGPDVIFLHRMAKSEVKVGTGIDSYLMLTQAAAAATNVDQHASHLTPYAESFEHFGEVQTLVHDLAAAWASWPSAKPIYIAKDGAFWSGEIGVEGPAMVIWDYLILPEHKQVWMDMQSVEVAGGPGDRVGIGSDYHCVHTDAGVRFRVIDWRPFDYFSALEIDPLGSGLRYRETWEIVPDGATMIVRFSVATPFAGDDPPGERPGGDLAIRGLYEAYGMPMLRGLKAYLEALRPQPV